MATLKVFDSQTIHFYISHEAVVYDKVYPLVFSDHIVEHDIVTLLQFENAFLCEVLLDFSGFLKKKNSDVPIFFIDLQEESLVNFLKKSSFFFYLFRVFENLPQRLNSSLLCTLVFIILKKDGRIELRAVNSDLFNRRMFFYENLLELFDLVLQPLSLKRYHTFSVLMKIIPMVLFFRKFLVVLSFPFVFFRFIVIFHFVIVFIVFRIILFSFRLCLSMLMIVICSLSLFSFLSRVGFGFFLLDMFCLLNFIGSDPISLDFFFHLLLIIFVVIFKVGSSSLRIWIGSEIILRFIVSFLFFLEYLARAWILFLISLAIESFLL